MKSVEVEIFGRRFRLRSDNTKQTQAVAEAINAELNGLREMYENLDFTKLLLLLSLKKQDEINSLNDKNQKLEKELQRLTQMVENIVGET
ncbi:MAG: cell division protein ZapA [Candidatus Syntrophosphaera sp.]